MARWNNPIIERNRTPGNGFLDFTSRFHDGPKEIQMTKPESSMTDFLVAVSMVQYERNSLLDIAFMLVPLDHVTSVIVNANHGIV
jgi:hypothetical protein